MNSKKGFVLLFVGTLLITGCTKKTANRNEGNVLNIMIDFEVASIDPQIATEGTSLGFLRNFIEGLKQKNSDGVVVDALAAGETISPDGLTYTFKIRDDAFWSNGDPVTADDFVFGWQRGVDPKVASEYSYMLSDIGQVRNAAKIIKGELPVETLGIHVIDSKTLKIELEVPVPYFDQILCFPTLSPVNKSFYEKWGDKFSTSPETTLSNGPFILTDYQPAATSYALVKNEKYFDADRIKLSGLNYQVIKDSQQALLSYRNGDLDYVQISGDQTDVVKDDPELHTVRDGFLWYIVPNIKTVPELKNVNLRKALGFALDRESIVNDVLKDGSVSSFTGVPDGFAFDSNGNDFTPTRTEFPEDSAFDKQKAVEYYETAKKELNRSVFTFELIADDTGAQQKVATVIKDEIENTLPGITINLRILPKKQRVQEMYKGTFQLGLTRWGPDYADPMTYLGMWATNNANNYGLWSNKNYDALLEKCTTGEFRQKPAERWNAMKQAEKIMMDDAVIFPLYQQAESLLIKSNVHDVALVLFASNKFKFASKK